MPEINTLSILPDPSLAEIETDVVIIGSGIAGLLLAHELAENGINVVIATKDSLLDSNTRYAQGGVAAVIADAFGDSKEAHLNDTIKSGAGLTIEEIAGEIIDGGDALIKKLVALGVKFDKTESGQISMHLEGGHSQRRVLHSKDATGKTIADQLAAALRLQSQGIDAISKVVILENAFALDLIMSAEKQTCGVLLMTQTEVVAVKAQTVVLATGGIGQIFERTTNPLVATGDGIAIAARAGAKLVDMEFVQFHPTAFFKEGYPAFLISEAVRGQGAILTDETGHRFAFDFHKDGELATRDVVANAIHQTMTTRAIPNVFLDLRPIGISQLRENFPNILAALAAAGFDATLEPVPVCPAAHYFMGGVATNTTGQTSIEGLFAIGECASTGLHGANRLASNSLLEAGVMALNLAEYLVQNKKTSTIDIRKSTKAYQQLIKSSDCSVPADGDKRLLQSLMYKGAGLVRNAKGLNAVQNALGAITTYKTSFARRDRESANMLLIAKLIVGACMRRQESRGSHLRSDFPETDNVHHAHRLTVQNGSWNAEKLEKFHLASVQKPLIVTR